MTRTTCSPTRPIRAFIETMNGTGPYMLDEWRRGQEVVLSANDTFIGASAAKSPSCGHPLVIDGGPEVHRAPVGRRRRHRQRPAGRPRGHPSDPNIQLVGREGFNTLYVGMNHSVIPASRPGRARRSARRSRWASTPGPHRPVLPRGLGGREPLRAVQHGVRLRRRPVVRRSMPGRQSAPRRGPDRARLHAGCRRQLAWGDGSPWQPAVQYRFVAHLPAAPGPGRIALVTSSRTTWASRRASTRSRRPPTSTSATPASCTGSSCSAGTVTTPMSRTSSTTTSVAARRRFGEHYPDIVAALNAGNSTADPAAREAA